MTTRPSDEAVASLFQRVTALEEKVRQLTIVVDNLRIERGLFVPPEEQYFRIVPLPGHKQQSKHKGCSSDTVKKVWERSNGKYGGTCVGCGRLRQFATKPVPIDACLPPPAPTKEPAR